VRSRARRLLAVLVATLALAGCGGGLPAGVDGNLTNDWSAMPLPKVAVPVAGVCYVQPYTSVWIGDFDPVDCAQSHHTETAYVGTFGGTDGQRSTPPTLGSPALRTAYDGCQQGASAYLGGDWHTELVTLRLTRPSDNAWTGGARWYRCDLIHWATLFTGTIADRGSLKGDLTGARTAALGCLTTTLDKDQSITEADPIDCGQPHQAEFAGLYTAPDVPFPSDKTTRESVLDRHCETVVGKFLGYPDGSGGNLAVGYWVTGWGEDQWNLGDRTVECFAYAYTKSGKFVGSVKGIRNQTPKG
jgi:hypothetical protein